MNNEPKYTIKRDNSGLILLESAWKSGYKEYEIVEGTTVKQTLGNLLNPDDNSDEIENLYKTISVFR